MEEDSQRELLKFGKIRDTFSLHKNVTTLKFIISSPLGLEERTNSYLKNVFSSTVKLLPMCGKIKNVFLHKLYPYFYMIFEINKQ